MKRFYTIQLNILLISIVIMFWLLIKEYYWSLTRNEFGDVFFNGTLGLILVLIIKHFSFFYHISVSKFTFHVARPYRELYKAESDELVKFYSRFKDKRENVYLYFDNPREYLIQIMVLVLGMLSMISLGVGSSATWAGSNSMFFGLTGLILAGYTFVLYQDYKGYFIQDSLAELTSPVMLIQGAVGHTYNAEKELQSLFVGRYEFLFDRVSAQYRRHFKNFHAGDFVTIEFSPYSHYVWKIERLGT